MALYFDTYLSKPDEGAYPFCPFGHVRLQMANTLPAKPVLIGPQLMTEDEVDSLIDRLQSDLEEVRKDLKKKLDI